VKTKFVVVVVALSGWVVAGILAWRLSHQPDRAAPYVDEASVYPGKTLAPPPPDGGHQPSSASRSVIINGQRLSDQDVQTLEQTGQARVADGNYWYDPMTGGWGQTGGPCAGIVLAGLHLGGPLRADASSGDTGVFINGRELHRVDVARLMQVVPVFRGRYWMDAQGNFGYEGQPASGNIVVAAAAAAQANGGGGVRREGILSTYDKTGVAVFGY
jgi:hypothetical protein